MIFDLNTLKTADLDLLFSLINQNVKPLKLVKKTANKIELELNIAKVTYTVKWYAKHFHPVGRSRKL